MNVQSVIAGEYTAPPEISQKMHVITIQQLGTQIMSCYTHGYVDERELLIGSESQH